MIKKRVKNKVKGMRDGIDKKEIMASMDEQDWQDLELKKQYKDINNKNALTVAARTDQAYQQYDNVLSLMESYTFKITDAKRQIDLNKQEVLKGDITKIFPNTSRPMTARDLDIENIMLTRTVSDNLRELWNVLTILSKYITVTRLDGYVYLTDEMYNKKFKWVENELKKQGIELLQER